MYHNVNTQCILAQNTFASNDTWTTGLNNNDLLVGPSGAGKTWGYVIPNLLHAGESLIVAGTRGEPAPAVREAPRGEGLYGDAPGFHRRGQHPLGL